jgi:hypothetical protein
LVSHAHLSLIQFSFKKSSAKVPTLAKAVTLLRDAFEFTFTVDVRAYQSSGSL